MIVIVLIGYWAYVIVNVLKIPQNYLNEHLVDKYFPQKSYLKIFQEKIGQSCKYFFSRLRSIYMSKLIYIMHHTNKEKYGLPDENAVYEYLLRGMMEDEDGRYMNRNRGSPDCNIVIFSWKGDSGVYIYGDLEIERKLQRDEFTEEETKLYNSVYKVSKINVYPSKIEQSKILAITDEKPWYSLPLKIDESQYQEILKYTRGPPDYRIQNMISLLYMKEYWHEIPPRSAKIYRFKCENCTLEFPNGWGWCLYIKDKDGKRISCGHPGEFFSMTEAFDYEFNREKYRERVGKNYVAICTQCFTQTEIDVMRDDRICKECGELSVRTLIELLGETCPKCKNGAIIKIETGTMS